MTRRDLRPRRTANPDGFCCPQASLADPKFQDLKRTYTHLPDLLATSVRIHNQALSGLSPRTAELSGTEIDQLGRWALFRTALSGRVRRVGAGRLVRAHANRLDRYFPIRRRWSSRAPVIEEEVQSIARAIDVDLRSGIATSNNRTSAREAPRPRTAALAATRYSPRSHRRDAVLQPDLRVQAARARGHPCAWARRHGR